MKEDVNDLIADSWDTLKNRCPEGFADNEREFQVMMLFTVLGGINGQTANTGDVISANYKIAEHLISRRQGFIWYETTPYTNFKKKQQNEDAS